VTAAGRWPDLLLVGAAHAGTSVLRGALARHPDVVFAEPEEPHFFSGIRPARRFARQIPVVSDEAAYRALFAGMPPDVVAAEASTSYLWSPEAPARIHAANPEARIVILLRDPVERAWAHHRADQTGEAERRGFLRAIRDELSRPGRWGQDQVYLGAGFYADALERYLGLFGRERVWVGFHETLGADARWPAREIIAWLGRDPDRLVAPTVPASPTRTGPTARSRRGSWLDALRGRSSAGPPFEPEMDDPIRRLLAEVYVPDVTRVSELLGIVPPWSISPSP
jgi:hypothetical protein